MPSLHADGPRHAHFSASFRRQQHEDQENEQQPDCQREQREERKDARKNVIRLLRCMHPLLLYLVDGRASRNIVPDGIFCPLRKVNAVGVDVVVQRDKHFRDSIAIPFELQEGFVLSQDIRRGTD